MATEGIQGLVIETHNWGATVAFWQGLGYELQFESDHHSGQLAHPSGGPFVFVAERPESQELETYPVVHSPDSATFEPPAGAPVEKPFTPEHWGVVEMMLRDPDGRHVSVQAPLPDGVAVPAGHG